MKMNIRPNNEPNNEPKIEPVFEENNTKRIWDDYFYRVEKITKPLNTKQKEELTAELKSHLYESFSSREHGNEVEKLLDAIDKFGKPEDYLKPMVSERLMNSGKESLYPKNIFMGALYSSYNSSVVTMKMFFIGLGFMSSLIFAVIAVFKPLYPRNVGFFYKAGDFLTIGIKGESVPLMYDPLGMWTIPVSIILAVLIYLGMTKSLKRMSRRKK